MKLYDFTMAPNPRRVRIFMVEKGVEVPMVQVNLMTAENRQPPFLAKNPMGGVPVLELDDGTLISESVAICRYFEEQKPEPPLMGVDAKDRAVVEMWNRRLELNLLFTVASVFRHLHPAMKEMEQPQVPQWAEANKPRVLDFLTLLDAQLKGRPYVTGTDFTVADITGLVAIDLMKPAKLGVPDHLLQVRRWHAEVSLRPSASA